MVWCGNVSNSGGGRGKRGEGSCGGGTSVSIGKVN